MAYKTVKFADMTVGTQFRLAIDGQDASKITPRRAFNLAQQATFPLGASVKCLVWEADPTPEELAAGRREWLRRRLEEMKRGSAGAIESFRAKLEQNPLYAFEWADRAIDAAAELEAGTRLMAVLDNDKHATDTDAVNVTIKMAREEAMRGARWPSRSTSPVSNAAKAALVSAYAGLVSDYDDK